MKFFTNLLVMTLAGLASAELVSVTACTPATASSTAPVTSASSTSSSSVSSSATTTSASSTETPSETAQTQETTLCEKGESPVMGLSFCSRGANTHMYRQLPDDPNKPIGTGVKSQKWGDLEVNSTWAAYCWGNLTTEIERLYPLGVRYAAAELPADSYATLVHVPRECALQVKSVDGAGGVDGGFQMGDLDVQWLLREGLGHSYRTGGYFMSYGRMTCANSTAQTLQQMDPALEGSSTMLLDWRVVPVNAQDQTLALDAEVEDAAESSSTTAAATSTTAAISTTSEAPAATTTGTNDKRWWRA